MGRVVRAPLGAPVEAENLDPSDWAEFGRLAHRMVDDVVSYLAGVRDRPVWQPVPGSAKKALHRPVPRESRDPSDVYDDFREHVMPYSLGNIHPRFWGWVIGSGLPVGVLADFLASAMNPNVGGYDQSAAVVEEQVHSWMAELLGMPATSSGILVSGGSQANLDGLTVARSARAGFDVRAEGVRGGPQLTFYASSETHNSVRKAVELLGHGRTALRTIPVDADYRIRVDLLESAIKVDRAQGMRPVCVVGCAGTVNTGAVDDLRAIGALCRRLGVWFHVDAAFGAALALSSVHKGLIDGIGDADSVAYDFHKWFYMPYDIGGLLVRDRQAHEAAFDSSASYLRAQAGGIAPGPLMFAQRGVDLSRGFRALNAWMCLSAYGTKRLGRSIDANVALAARLAKRVDDHPRLERLAPAPTNIVCFRYVGAMSDEKRIEEFNRETQVMLQERGIAVVSNTRVNDRFALRAAITNHRSRDADIDVLVNEILKYGKQRRR